MSVFLPKLTQAKFVGYRPIFETTVHFEVKNNILILLGGNGLGKTTILQSIVYAIAGPLDAKIEIDLSKRWTKKYFTDRLDNSESAFIEIEFKLNKDTIKLKRGFLTERILEFHLNNRIVSNDKTDSDSLFENFLISNCGYDSLNSFRFLIHKLCFLSENREQLVWDTETQTRVLMLIFSDSIAENSFRSKNDQLQKIDSKIRHLQVDINKLTDSLKTQKVTKKKGSSSSITKLEEADNKIAELKKQYLDSINSRLDIQKEVNQIRQELSTVNELLQDIQEKLTQNEQIFLTKQLSNYESSEAKLALYKLIHNKICPACSSQSEPLYRTALKNLQNDSCPLCGTFQDVEIEALAPGLEADLTEKLNIKVNKESELIEKENLLFDIVTRENALQFDINRYMLEAPAFGMLKDYGSKPTSKTTLQSNLSRSIREQTDFKIKFETLKLELEREYEGFSKKNNERIQKLSSLYQEYATEFLGIECTLNPIENNNDFLSLKLFVPSFNGKIRSTPDSCSEAQRFFLDIAFRMALIEMVSVLTKTFASFICETPENALDITYRNNVAEMFRIFTNKKNSIILSSNIQPNGIAESLLFHIQKEKRKDAILNMLDIGQLSKVQSSHLAVLQDIIRKLLNSKNVSNK